MSAIRTTHLLYVALWLAIQNSAHSDDDLYLYDKNYVFVCYVRDRDDAYEFQLACQPSLACVLVAYKNNEYHEDVAILDLPDLGALTDNCTDLINNFGKYYSAQFPLTNGKYIVHKSEIKQLGFQRIRVTHVRPDFLCEMNSLTRLEWTGNTVKNSLDFGFGDQCVDSGQAPCCACNLIHLNLWNNALQVIGNASFCKLTNVEIIDLSANKISEIHENAFSMVAKLRHLNLSKNQLKALHPSVLRPFGGGLGILNLNSNSLTEEVYLALRQVPSLRELHLQYNDISNLSYLIEALRYNEARILTEQPVQPFPQLQILNVGHNRIGQVSAGDFVGMAQLEEIDLSSNRLYHLSDGLLSTNSRIRTLSVDDNQLTAMPALNSTSLDTLSLKSNRIAEITSTDRDHLCQLSNLKKLYLEGNRIRTIVPGAFRWCPSASNHSHSTVDDDDDVFDRNGISLLYMAANKIEAFSFQDFSDHLRELDLSDNQIKTFPSDYGILTRPMALKKLVLSGNQLANVTEVLLPPNLEHLELRSSSIEFFSFKKTAHGDGWMIPPQLQTVDLSSNKLEVLCNLVYWIANEKQNVSLNLLLKGNPLQCLCETDFLDILYDSASVVPRPAIFFPSCTVDYGISSENSSTLATVASLYSCPPRRSHMNCQCNLNSLYSAKCGLPCPASCTCYIDKNFTTYLVNCSGRHIGNASQLDVHPRLSCMTELDFSENHLEQLYSTLFLPYGVVKKLSLRSNKLMEIAYDAFWSLTDLEVLDLGDNLLEELPSGLFANSTRLTRLNLSGNRLANFPADLFRPLASIQALHLQNNFLSNFSVWRFRDLTTLSALRLSGNLWSCDCAYMRQFQNWLQNSSLLVQDVKNLDCTSGSGDTETRQSMLSFNYSECYEVSPVFVSTGKGTVAWTTVVSVMLFATVVCALLFLYRREMQVLIFNRYGVRLFQRQEDGDEEKLYDVFVAYSSHDLEFVAHSLIPGLEHIERPYRVCLHHRDFLVGAIITNSILEAIENSRRTIIILSRNFVSSGWCVYEFKSAHLKMLTDRCSRIIVILMEDVPQNIDPEIKVYLRTNTYLKWGDKLFWQKLYYALPDRKEDA